jgi:hypothetical protein
VGLRRRLALGDVALLGGAESGGAESGSAELLHSSGSAEIVLMTHATRRCSLAVGSAGKGLAMESPALTVETAAKFWS